MNDNNINNVPSMESNNGPIMTPKPDMNNGINNGVNPNPSVAPVPPVAPEPQPMPQVVSETPVVATNLQAEPKPQSEVMPETLKEEIKKEVASQVKTKKKKHVVRNIFNFLITVALLIWVGIVVYDFYNVSNKKEPKFCIEKGTTKTDDGVYDWCKGPGYVAYKYNYKEYEAYEFGPFWQEPKTLEEIKAK